jgi:hypothetical protein
MGGGGEIIYPPHHSLTRDFSLLLLDLSTFYRMISHLIRLTISSFKPIASKYISVCKVAVDSLGLI